MTFSASLLHEQLLRLPSGRHYRVAFSGGLDSCVLLHAMCVLREQADWQLSAIHVHHGLNPAADEWVRFCQDLCAQWHVTCNVLYVEAAKLGGESPEATARTARYQAMAGQLQAGELLLTAHHQDDQAETVLLQLMRGSGVPGLAAIPPQSPFAQAYLLRPLLAFQREALRDYALQQQLDWVEDSSNADTLFDRNYMRHEILPLMANRWPAVAANLSRTSGHMREALELLESIAAADLQEVISEDAYILELSKLARLDAARQRNLLRYWLRRLGLPVPTQAQMQHVLADIIEAETDTSPCVRWPGVELRAYRRRLYAYPAMSVIDTQLDIVWDMREDLNIDGVGRLSVSHTRGKGLPVTLLGAQGLHVRLRQGSERVWPKGRGHHHSLKNLFQEAGIPPWQRARTPILYQGEQPVAVIGVCECEPFVVGEEEAGLLLHWEKCFS